MKTLIKNGHLVDPSSNVDGFYDVMIEDDKIIMIEEAIEESADQVIDAKGYHVVPGFIDLHVHLREPGYEYKETIKTGTMAAARGGFTSICPMPNTNPATDSKEMIEKVLKIAKEEGCVHVLPVGAITVGQAGKELADFEGMIKAGAVALSEDGKTVMDICLYKEAMKRATQLDVVVMAHCEDEELHNGGVINEGEASKRFGFKGISNSVEDVITARDILLAGEANARLHLCHCSTKGSAKILKLAKEEGIKVTGEVCPHHFTLTDQDIVNDDANFKMAPPLRSREDKETLIGALKTDIMDAISTDHAPHHRDEKAKGFEHAPNGIVGLETAFALGMTELVQKGHLTFNQLIDKMSATPAKILGIDKGSLQVGKVADITIVDTKAEYPIDSNSFVSKGKNTPFDGYQVVGKVMKTIVSGKIVYSDKSIKEQVLSVHNG